MYIIDSGRVRVFKTLVKGDSMQEIELCTLGPKSMFGEMAMIDDSKRSASIQAIEPTICTVITKKIFEDQLSAIPTWMVNMIKILVQRLRETNEKLRLMVEECTGKPSDDVGGIVAVDDERSRALHKEIHKMESGSVLDNIKNDIDDLLSGG
jgi:CRP-like cAMP-binding protein